MTSYMVVHIFLSEYVQDLVVKKTYPAENLQT